MINMKIEDLLNDIRKLKTNLKRTATMEAKWVGDDISHHQGMRKGMYIAYNESALKIEKVLKKYGN